MIKLTNILTKSNVNELKLNDLVGNQYKYVIGSGEEKYLGTNDKKYVLEMIEKSLEHYLYDHNFALNYLDSSQQKQYDSFFEKEVLKPMLSKIDFTLNNFFTLDKDKVKWKLSSNDTRKIVDEIFRKNSKIPADIKKEYYEYRLDYAGVKLKESVNEVGVNDWHFKEIKKLWDKAGSFTKKKIASLITKNPNSTWSKIEDILRGADYNDVTYYTDKLQLELVNESAKSDKLAILMNKVIEKVDSSLSYKDFAMAVGKILKDDYGSHLYSAFVQELNKELKKENENLSKLTTYLPTENKSIDETLTISIRNLLNDLVPRDIQNATTPQQQERRQSFIRDLVKTLNQFYKQNRVDWRFADSNIKFKMYSKD